MKIGLQISVCSKLHLKVMFRFFMLLDYNTWMAWVGDSVELSMELRLKYCSLETYLKPALFCFIDYDDEYEDENGENNDASASTTSSKKVGTSPKKVTTTTGYSQHPWGIFFTILGTVLLDFDADACQSPSRFDSIKKKTFLHL